jgi:hypothetical protein
VEVAGNGVTKMMEVIVATLSTDSVEDERREFVDEVSSVERTIVEDRVRVKEVDVRLFFLPLFSFREVSFATAPKANRETRI